MTMRTEKACPIRCLAAGLAAAALWPVAAQGADATAGEAAGIYDTVVYWGGDFNRASSSQYGAGIDAGFVTAINGDIGATGWTLTGNIGFGRSVGILSDTDSTYGSFLLGYQWHLPGFYVALGGGINVVDNDETPPGGITDGTEAGAIVQYGFETKSTNAFYAQSYGAYSTANDQVYFHAKTGYKSSTLRFGPEFTAFDDEGGKATLRYGAFVGDIPIGDRLNMTVSAGYQHELDPGVKDGFYATVGFSVQLSLR